MENKKAVLFALSIAAIILGVTLFKQFDFDTLKFRKPALAIVYLVGFTISVYFLMKNFKNQRKKRLPLTDKTSAGVEHQG